MASVVENARREAENTFFTSLSPHKTSHRENSSSGSSDCEVRRNKSTAMATLLQKTASPQTRRRKVKLFKDRAKTSAASPKRRTLQTLQPIAKSGQLAGNNTILRFLDKKSTKRKSCSEAEGDSHKPVKLPRADLVSRTVTPVIYEDQQDSSCTNSTSGDEGKSLAQEALEIMNKESASELDWQKLAEERRLALIDTLEENKELHQKLEEKDQKLEEKNAVIQELTEENETLKKMAEQAEEILSILKPVTEDERPESEEDKVPDGASASPASAPQTEEVGASSHEGSDSS